MFEVCESSNNLRAFKKLICQIINPEKLCVDEGTAENGGTFENFCKEVNIEAYSTMSETKTAFAEKSFWSLNQIIYRYIADYGEKFVSKLKQFVSNMNCGKNWWSNGNKKKRCEKNDFLSILHLTSFVKNTKSKVEIGVRMRNLKNVISFQTDTSHSLPMKYSINQNRQPYNQNSQNRKNCRLIL